ncbi:hypothetical protein K504DRAFT_492803 [Pleomassaria siparia CBS 279.74]|uniref:Amidoligase enzyme n=1 Tax=Pleomassaria siparia CBS 279.74 TaxID=1314801 RepID=A0A6G1K451_9PLEO|nr:hypothetical protein K504DRAFT_492803 [Pleomassaria siparia CBS 279.74]
MASTDLRQIFSSWHLCFFTLTCTPFTDVHYCTLCSSYFRSHFIMSSLATSQSLLHGHHRARRSTFSTAPPALATLRPIPLSPTPLSPPPSPVSHYLPFNFGAEFELIIRPKDISSLSPNLRLPEFDANHDPVEIVTPVVKADATWVATIDKFWSIIQRHFVLRRDTSCGMHIHVSPQQGKIDIVQLRCIAKAVVLWERDTARYFCLSNVKGRVPVADVLRTHGPVRGLRHAFRYIDQASRDGIINYVCPDKHHAWSFLPSREAGHGSVEFRRPPGVVNAKKAKHWIAFTMAFVDMAMRNNVGRISRRLPKQHYRRRRAAGTISQPTFDFDDLLLALAELLGVYSIFDPRLRQSDEPRSLHITMMRPDCFDWLQRFDDVAYSAHLIYTIFASPQASSIDHQSRLTI